MGKCYLDFLQDHFTGLLPEESYKALLEEIILIINNQPCEPGTTPDKEILISLIIYVLIEKKLIPQLILDRIESKDPFNKPELYSAIAKHLPEVLAYAKSTPKSVVNLQMTLIGSTLKFNILIANYGRGTFKVTFTSTEISKDTVSFVYIISNYVLVTTEGQIKITLDQIKEFTEQTRISLLDPLLQKWHLYQCSRPCLVVDSNGLHKPTHLKLALNILDRTSSSSDDMPGRDLLILILSLVLAEREIIPELLKDHIKCPGNLVQNFSYNKDLCESVAKNISLILEYAHQQKNSVLRLQMIHKNADLSFNILITKYSKGSYKVTFMQPSPSTATTSFVFDMNKYKDDTPTGDSKNQFKFNQISIDADLISNRLLYPILTMWWQQKAMYTRTPYLLGIPGNCTGKISQYLRKQERKKLRLTCRQLRTNVSL